MVGWGAPVEGFAWSSVEFGGDGGEVLGAVNGEVGAFREVLAKQAVGRSYVCQAAAAAWFVRTAASIRR